MALLHSYTATGTNDPTKQVSVDRWNADHSIDSNGLVIPESTSIPAAPAAGNLRLWARERAGRMLPMMIGPSGIDSALQPALFGNNVCMWLAGGGTTAAISFGVSWTVGATQSHPTPTSTNYQAQMKRAQYTTTTTSGNASGVRTLSSACWRGNAAGLGGFFYFSRFGVTTYVASMQIMNGLSGLTGLLAGEPSAQNNTFCIGKDQADTDWQLIMRSASATTKVNLGLAIAAGQVLDFTCFCPPNSSSITARVVDAVTGAVVLDNVSYTTNLPTNTTFLYAHNDCRTNAASAVAICLNRIYIESDT